MMALLFGSRYRGDNRPDSDIDVFLTDDEVGKIPQGLLICHGGPVDAFYMPDDGDDLAWPVILGFEQDDERVDWERRLVVYDKYGPTVEVAKVSLMWVIQMGLKLQGFRYFVNDLGMWTVDGMPWLVSDGEFPWDEAYDLTSSPQAYEQVRLGWETRRWVRRCADRERRRRGQTWAQYYQD